MQLPSEWVDKARVLFSEAHRHLEEGHYWLTCFEAQQAAELFLEALLVSLTGTHSFTHDLVELIEALRDLGCKPPEELYMYADALTPHHTMARYPGRKPVRYDRGLGERCLRYAGKIIEWVEKASKELEEEG